MNIWEIRRLCHYLRCAADNRKIADFQREQDATVIETLLDQVEGLWKDNQHIAGEVMQIQRTDGVRDVSVTYTRTYADAATHKQVSDLACAVFCGLMAEDLKRRGEHGTVDIETRLD